MCLCFPPCLPHPSRKSLLNDIRLPRDHCVALAMNGGSVAKKIKRNARARAHALTACNPFNLSLCAQCAARVDSCARRERIRPGSPFPVGLLRGNEITGLPLKLARRRTIGPITRHLSAWRCCHHHKQRPPFVVSRYAFLLLRSVREKGF